jgi:class 3 adenylate cyclase
MDRLTVETILLTSKEVLEKTGISRATLNNYISCGIVRRPEVLPPEPSDGAAPRIGYFPSETIARIEEIQRLKREGWSITRITQHFTGAGGPAPDESVVEATEAPVIPADQGTSGAMPSLSSGAPGGMGLPEVSTLPVRPEQTGGAAGRRQTPSLTQVAVLVTQLQDAARLWCELPPEEYFELINEIWLAVDPIFKRHQGTNGKHPGEGMVCYFLPRPGSSHLWNALLAAQQMREAMRRVSKHWQLRKGWTCDLYMNMGIDEGQEWHGTLRPGSPELTVLGDAVDRAMHISNFARDGAVWVTRNLVSKLPTDERRRLKHGVRRLDKDGRDRLVASTFSRVENLAGLTDAGSEGLTAIARLPVTEVFDVAAQAGDDPDRAAGLLPL